MFETPFSLRQVQLGKRFLYLIFLVVLIGSADISRSLDVKVNGQSAIQSCPTCRPPSQQIIYAPLVELNGSLNTEINLNCRSPHPIDVVLTFYTDSGMPFTGETIHLTPGEMRFVSIQQLIPGQHLNQHKWGGVALSYTGNLMEVWAQLTIHGVGSKGSANVLFAVVDARRSNTQEAVWRMPKNATATLAMGNYSDTPAGATLTFSNGDVEQVYLAPYAAKVITRKNNGQNSTGIDAESVRVEASGQIGRFITTGVIASNNGKYASSLRFYDRENTFQPNLYSTNFRLKNSTPHIVLKNTTANPITARPRFLPKTGEGSGVVELPAVTLPPNAVKELNLSSLISAATTRPELDSVAVQIINSGEKGSLIGAANFTDNVTGVDYDIPLRDSGASARAAGGYPIRLDGDYSTILSLTNTGSAVGKFTLQINYAGGIYALYPQEVAAGATALFDLRQIRDRQMPDSSGRVLPVDLTIGQIRWSQVGGTATTLIGRSEIVSKTNKVSSSYSCNICCRNSYQSSRLTPDQVFEFLGGTTQITARQKDRDCYDNYFAEYDVYNPGWSSSNASVVDFYGANGVAYALDVGSAMLTATWEAEYFLESGSDTCDAYPVIAAPTGEMNVQPPTVQKLQYQEPGSSTFTDITSTLFVLKGSSVTFKAIPNPVNATFPSGQPTWSGTSGATGTGQTISVTFNTTSSSTTDYKTVVASTTPGTPVTVNVVVYELTPILNPDDEFAGRSFTNYGLLEKIYLEFSVTPAITFTEIGGMRWEITQGIGSVTNDARLNGYGIFDADNIPGSVTLTIKVASGPSKGAGIPISLNVIAPSGAYMVRLPSDPVLHCQNFSSVGFLGQIYLEPKNVSFANIFFREGYSIGTSQASGFYSPVNGQQHDPTSIGIAVSNCNILTGCETFKDTIYSLNWTNWTGNWGVGQFTWVIEWKYGFGENDPIRTYRRFTTATHYGTTDAQGTATISKAGAGPFSKMVADSTVSFSCGFPQAP